MKHADQSNAALKPGKLTQPLSVRIQTTLKKMGRQWQIQFMALSGVVWMAIFSYIPLIFLVIAFMDYKVSIPLFENQSVGLKHFKAFLTDDRFWRSVVNTLGISALKITIGFVVPIIFALLLNEVKNPKFKKVVQSLSYMPHFISWAIFGGIMLNWMSSTGLINQIMLSLGLQSRSILYNADPDNFWTISFITDTFKETGWSAIIYLAAIAGIDPGLYESAELDGANRWQKMWYITLQCIRPTISILFILAVSGCLVDSNDQVKEKTNNGQYFCMLREYTDVQEANGILASSDDPDSIYIAVDGPMNSAKDDPLIFPGSMDGWMTTFISKDCENPERAIAFLTYLCSEEGQMDMFMGVEGETYDMVDGKPVLKEELQELYSSNFDSFSNDYGLYDTYWMLRNKPLVDQWRMENPDYITQMSDWANAHADLDGGIYNNLEPTGDNDAGIAATSISQKWEEVLPQLITAESDEKFDQIMADYVQWRENNGYAQVVEYEQNLLDTRKEMLS